MSLPITNTEDDISFSLLEKPIENRETEDKKIISSSDDKLTDLDSLPLVKVEDEPEKTTKEKESPKQLFKSARDFVEDYKTSMNVTRQLALRSVLGESSVDIQKDAIGAAVNQFSNLRRTINYLKHRNNLPEEEQTKLDDSIKEQSKEFYDSILKGVGILRDLQEPVFDVDTGKIITTRTALTGTLTELATPLATGAMASPYVTPVGGLIVGGLTYQALSNPEDNMTNFLKDLGFDKPSKARDELTGYIFSENLSDEDKERGTLLLEEALFLGAAPLLIKGTKAVKGIGQGLMEYAAPILDNLKKPYDLLSDEEKAEVVFNSLRSAGQQIKRQAGGREGFVGNILNTTAAIERFGRQIFTSTGFSPEPLRRINEQRKQFKTAALKNAMRLSSKMDDLIEELAGKSSTSSDQIRKKIQQALTEGVELPDNFRLVSPGEPIPNKTLLSADELKKALRENEEFAVLSDDILDVVVDTRTTIDSYSNQIQQTLDVEPNSEAAAKIMDSIRFNIGNYLNVSYRIHDKGWTVDKRMYQDTVEHFTKRNIEMNPDLTPDEAKVKAIEFVDDFLAGQQKTLGNNNSLVERVISRDTSPLEEKTLEDPVLRRLAGEISDPAERTLTTLSKMANLLADSKYFQELYTQGTTSKYPFLFAAGKRNPKEAQIYSYKIEGTNSKLDGMYTTPEIGLVLKDREAALTPIFGSIFTKSALDTAGVLTVIGANSLAVNLAEVKGLTQKLKTVYSLTTHLRNGLGGLFMNVAQGHNPFNKDFAKVFKSIASKSDDELVEFNNKLLQLGVINTSPRLREFKELLTEYNNVLGSERDQLIGMERFYSAVRNIGSKVGTKKLNLNTIDDYLQKVYMGTDDFFKTSLFLKERDVLKKAYPDMSESALDQEAAEIVKNVMPNYDRVTPAAKSLKNVPFLGAFIGFSAEVMRTGARTIARSTKELASENPVIKKRGLTRLTAWGLTAGVSSKAVEQGSAAVIGWTDKQLEAVKTFYNPDYGAQTYLFVEDENGQIDKLNLTMTDPWTILRQPFYEAAQARINGEISTKEEGDIQTKETVAFLRGLARPYVSETVANQAVSDFIVSMQTGKRASPGGYHRDMGGTTPIENLPRAFENFMFDLGPNILKEAKEFKDIIIDEEAVGVYVEPKDKADYLSKRFTTLPRDKVNLLVDLKQKIKTFKYELNRAKPSNLRNINSYEDLVSKYKKANEETIKASQKLYIALKAVEDYYNVSSEGRQLARQTIKNYAREDKDVLSVVYGISPKINVNKSSLFSSLEALRKEGKLPYNYSDFDQAMDKFSSEVLLDYENYDLNKIENINEQDILTRLSKAVGGEVDVPRAAPEPDERIDKMTGLPYNIQAGIPFRDEEDPIKRLGLAGGSMAVDPMQRLGFAAGGIKKVVQSAKDIKEDVSEQIVKGLEAGDKAISDAYKYIINYTGKNQFFFKKDPQSLSNKDVFIPTKPITDRLEEELSRVKLREDAVDILPAPGKFVNPEKRGFKGEKFVANLPEDIDIEYGNYYSIDLSKGKPIFNTVSDQVFENAYITARTSRKGIDPEDNKAVLRSIPVDYKLTKEEMRKASKENLGKRVSQVQMNLLQPELFKFIGKNGEELKARSPITGVESSQNKGMILKEGKELKQTSHVYAYDIKVEGPVIMNKITQGDQQPNLRPFTVGEITPGKIVGKIKVQGNIHNLYDQIFIDSTGALPKGKIPRDKFIGGGLAKLGRSLFGSSKNLPVIKADSSVPNIVKNLDNVIKQYENELKETKGTVDIKRINQKYKIYFDEIKKRKLLDKIKRADRKGKYGDKVTSIIEFFEENPKKSAAVAVGLPTAFANKVEPNYADE